MVNNREQAFKQWLVNQLLEAQYYIDDMSGDAGFRQYSRIIISTSSSSLIEKSYIAVNAPPDKSNNQAFVTIANVLSSNGIVVPRIIHSDFEQGFFIISDLGNTLLSDVLTNENMIFYYQKAIDELLKISNISEHTYDYQSNHQSEEVQNYNLPLYDGEFIQTELNIFTQWLLAKYLSIELSMNEKEQLQTCFELCIQNALEQPYVFMHRDFHSRNLMITKNNDISVIDFQDAVKGPVTYDIVSLLKDCYRRWPQEDVTPLLEYFIKKISPTLTKQYSLQQWFKWFDLMGLQRHLKASGIFARLHLRDNKSGYLTDIPLTLSYIVDVSKQYSELTFLHSLLNEKVIPALKAKTCEQ